MSDDERFNVHQFLPDGYHECIGMGLSIRDALLMAHKWTLPSRPGVIIGAIRRVIITDSGDCTVWEWKNGEGVTFPPSEGEAA